MSAKIQLQHFTAVIHNTSRFGLDHDVVHVENLLATTEPLPEDSSWYVPSEADVPDAVREFLRSYNLQPFPIRDNIGTEDIHLLATSGNMDATIQMCAKAMLLSTMKNTKLTPIAGSNNLYKLSYDYYLYPDKDGYYELHVQLPFSGLVLNPSRGRVQVTALCPIESTIDRVFTKGIDENSQEINEAVTITQNNVVVNFAYQLDPLFAIRYRY